MANFRSLNRQLHLWLGLSLGLLLALLSLTGSALVFYIEIDAVLNSAAHTEPAGNAPDWQSAVWDDVLATARRAYPDPDGEWSFEVNGEAGPIPARFYPSLEHHGHHAERAMVWFSADGKQVIRAQIWGEYLMSWLYELHMHLLAGETGRLVVGWGGLTTLLLLVSGLVAWWPRGSWRKALVFKSRAVPLRRLRDLHKHGGLWSLPLLILLVFTGVMLALPDLKEQIFTSVIGPADVVPQPQSVQASGVQIPLRQALASAHAALPDAQLAFIDVPGAGTAPFRMRVQVPGDPHRRFPGSFIFVDQYSGHVLAVHDIGRGSASMGVAKWIRAIHDGSIAGLGTRLVAIGVGLMPAALLVTGFLYWRQRRARRQDYTHSHHANHRT